LKTIFPFNYSCLIWTIIFNDL